MGRDKREMLLDLKNEMERQLAGATDYGLWFHESLWGVDGYLGTDSIMFVAQRPSTATTNTAAFRRFYRLLREYGFAQSHVTDLVKERMESGTIPKKQLDRNWPFFLKELSIVRPTALVALKGDVFGVLSKRLGHELPVLRMLHYSWRYGSNTEVEQRFKSEFERIRTELANHGKSVRMDLPEPYEVEGLPEPDEIEGLPEPYEVEGLPEPDEIEDLPEPDEVEDLPEPDEVEDRRVLALRGLHGVRKAHYSQPLSDAVERCYEAGCSHKHVMRVLRHGWDPQKALTHRRGGAGSDDD